MLIHQILSRRYNEMNEAKEYVLELLSKRRGEKKNE